MNTSFVKYNVMYALIALLIAGLCYYVLPTRPIKPHGIFLPTLSGEFTPLPDTQEVDVLSNYPTHYQSLGNISVMMMLPHSTDTIIQSHLEQCLDTAKALAKKNGAKAIVILKSAYYNRESGLNSTLIYAQALKNS